MPKQPNLMIRGKKRDDASIGLIKILVLLLDNSFLYILLSVMLECVVMLWLHSMTTIYDSGLIYRILSLCNNMEL